MIQITKKCACGHLFCKHDEGGCEDIEHDGQICMCAFNEFEAERCGYKEQLESLIEYINSTELQNK